MTPITCCAMISPPSHVCTIRYRSVWKISSWAFKQTRKYGYLWRPISSVFAKARNLWFLFPLAPVLSLSSCHEKVIKWHKLTNWDWETRGRGKRNHTFSIQGQSYTWFNSNEYPNLDANLKLNLISNCVPKHIRYHLVFKMKVFR